ncbi:MAG: retention module-containing protein [Candidatus Sedimenticola sp. (ex Thyasira tokunagai)]
MTTSTTTNPIGFVEFVKGAVTASTDGVFRTLVLGDPVFANDTILTGDAGIVTLLLNDGTRMDLGRNSEAVLDSEVYDIAAVEDVAAAIASVEAIQEAILAGADPTALLPPTAAGPTAAGAPGEDGGGHDFVTVELTGQRAAPESGFETTGLAFAFDQPEGEVIYLADEPLPTLSIDDVTTIEPSGYGERDYEFNDVAFVPTYAVFTVTLSEASNVDVRVDFATADGTAISGGLGVGESDYGSQSGTVTISAGSTSATIEIEIFGDEVYETTEQYLVNLSNPVNATIADDQGVGTILDEVMPTLSIDDTTVNENGTATLTVTLSHHAVGGVTVDFASANGSATLAAGDYTEITTGMLTFNPGDSLSQTITVDALDEGIYDPGEHYFVNLSSPTNATIFDGQGQVDITDEVMPTLSINDITIHEAGETSDTFTVSLTGGVTSYEDIEVSWSLSDDSAILDTDYSGPTSGTAVIAAGDTEATIDLPGLYQAIDDSEVEPDEFFNVTLTGATGSTSGDSYTMSDPNGLGTIVDDDVLPPHILTGALITNSNNETQILRMTLEDPDNPDHVFTTLITLESEGQQGSIFTEFALDAGFDIDPTVTYVASLQWVSGPKALVTDFELEGVVIIEGTTGLNYLVSQSTDHMIRAHIRPGDGPTGLILLEEITTPDSIDGHNAGGNTLNGTAEDDVIAGRDGDDILNGYAGNDVLFGGEGADTMDGGAGEDTATYFDSDDPVYVNLSSASYTAPDGTVVAPGAHGGDAQGDILTNIENVVGSEDGDDILVADGGNTLIGLAGDDILVGGDGNDVLIGGFDEDTLYGGAGNDILDGNSDPDIMTGGTGDDMFLYRHFDDAGDRITDYNQNEGGENDVIDIAQLLVGFTADPDTIGQFVQLEVQGGDTMLSVLDPKDSSFVDMGLLEGVVAGDQVTLVIDELGTEATLTVPV